MSSRFCNLYRQIICKLKENNYLFTDKMVASKRQIVSIIKEPCSVFFSKARMRPVESSDSLSTLENNNV